jgi:hypothetical protein
LLVGSVAGGLLVLRELAPYAAATPQWVLLGVAGLLVVAGAAGVGARAGNYRDPDGGPPPHR